MPKRIVGQLLRGVRRQLNKVTGAGARLGLVDTLRYSAATALGRPTVHVKINDVPLWIRPRSPDLHVASLSLDDEFEHLAHHLHRDFDGVIVDAGSYIGSAAIKLSRMYPKAQILCVEPASENFALLSRNTAGHPNIQIVNAALTAVSDGPLVLRDRGTGQWGFTTIAAPQDNPDAAHIEEVDTVSISDIAAMFPGRDIGLIKLDIEGGEKRLFSHGCPDLAQVPLVFVELHDRIVEGCTQSFEAFSRDREIVSFGGEKFLSIAAPQAADARPA